MQAKKTYLILYNFLLAIGWSSFFVHQVLNGFQLDSTSLLLLNICQVSAVLEILHAALKWVKSPVSTAFIQVFSRVFVLIFINILSANQQILLAGFSGVQIVSVAWGVTEIIRYSFYFFGLIEKNVKPIIYLRYTLFIVLYPLGVTGEWMILLSQIKLGEFQLSFLNAFLGITLLAYFYFFPQLYKYMFKQRKNRLK